ncbi:pentatricopeptide repeat-containing protein MRL1, chloroplastic [Ipomoea triloba]|uniref:pentatricopeptide repeat-containing protein MRL1, chloroplastic n=1 Tax=Ipomoea triloba TaxID=35885 RepID=UPI00125CF94B|nr:pentatricopeptide repeat-containing protein MRL1, chloroplastic [Ipomoea triloba]
MATTFSSKPQTLSLVSFAPLASHFSSRRCTNFLLGSTRSFRPPGLRSRRRCRKLSGFQFRSHSSAFHPVAYLDSQVAVVVAAVVTISALTIVYLRVSRKSPNTEQAPGGLAVAFLQQIRNKVRLIVDEFFRPTDTWEEKADGNLEREMAEISHEHETIVEVMQFSQNGSVGSLVNEVESPHLTTSTSNVTDSLVSGESEDAVSIDALPTTFVAEAHKVHLIEYLQESKITTNLPKVVVSSDSSAATDLVEKVDEIVRPEHELVADNKISTHNIFFRGPAREELYTFYEAEASAGNLESLGNSFSSASSERRTYLSPFSKGLAVSAAKSSSPYFLYPAENSNVKRSPGNYKGGASEEKEKLVKRKEISNKKEICILQPNSTNKFFQSPDLKGKNEYSRHHISEQISAYHKFLRNGRLTDCMQILEDMDDDGLLNMDKVYHAGFFQACKNKKAVEEAFRFMKLIHNPTLSTFNMLLSVCASCQDLEGAFQVLQFVQEAGLNADCKLYTTLITTCAKSGKVDTMFEVFHEMVNAGVEPNVHTFGALIDGCAKAGQVAKAFGAYGIMRSKNVKPDRVVFNALITACGQSGAVDRAFDVLAEMREETHPIDPDHITIGALMKACANAGQVDRALDVYNMIHEYNIKGCPELYTIAVNSCSQNGDWESACNVYSDMTKKGIVPDEMFISAMVDVAGHAGKLDTAFEVLKEARNKGINTGTISYSSLMGACCNTKNWQMALKLYDEIKEMNLKRTVSMMNALVTALCDADQLQKALTVLFEMKREGLPPNSITYSTLLVASEKTDDLDTGLMLLSQAKKNGVAPSLIMCRCLIAMCLRRFQKACTLGEPVLAYNSVQLQLNSKWTSLALMIYRETIAGVAPTMEELSLVLGCLQLPRNASLKEQLVENLVFTVDASKGSNLCSLVDGFGEYDPRAFQLLEEAASLGVIPLPSLKSSPIVVDVRDSQIHTAEVYLLAVLRGLKHRLAAGVKIPNIAILLPVEESQLQTPAGEKTIKFAGRISQTVAALLRRLGLPYIGNESHGKIRINGVSVKRWLQPKVDPPFGWKRTDLSLSETRLGKGIAHQQRKIRTGYLSLE